MRRLKVTGDDYLSMFSELVGYEGSGITSAYYHGGGFPIKSNVLHIL